VAREAEQVLAGTPPTDAFDRSPVTADRPWLSPLVRLPALGDRMIAATVTLPAEGQTVLVGLRPAHLTVTPGPSPLTLDLRERLGGVSYDYLRTPTGERIIAEARNDAMIPEGAPVQIDFEETAALFFHPETEQRIR
jgi:lactose/L-arabinose transport system ATP-binding protein